MDLDNKYDICPKGGGRCSVIFNPCFIEDRPAVVETRERFGDWEVDTVLGKHGTGALITLAGRKSRMYLVKRVDAKRAIDESWAPLIGQ